ncbi:Histone-lysine N-methyltransferase [Arthrobotrys megalospora]
MLTQSAWNGDVWQLLQEGGVHPDSVKDLEGRTPLFWAAQHGHIDIVQFMLEKGASSNLRGPDGLMPMWAAVYNKQEAIVRLLLKRTVDYRAHGPDRDRYQLNWATYHGDVETVEKMLEGDRNLDINFRDDWGATPLFWAAQNDHSKIVKLLLDKRAQVDPKNPDGRTPLHQATVRGSKEVAQVLLGRGADPQSQDRWGEEPLSSARARKNWELVYLLLDYNPAGA